MGGHYNASWLIDMEADARPRAAVTVILPTFNRAAFLPGAFEALSRQSFADWDLVIVDDGSTDNTRDVIRSFENSLGPRLGYAYQDNRGAYAARNRGLMDATGSYIAFYDSDDVWLPHHLERCVAALVENPDVDWVFGACRHVDLATGRTIEPSTFYVGGRPRPFLSLRTRSSNGLQVITDPGALECQILHGLYCGLQNSVIRRRVFDGKRFDDRSRVVDDELFVIRALSSGTRFGYFDDPHVIYQTHDANSSGSGSGGSTAKHIAIFTELTTGLEQVRAEVPLGARERRALAKRLGREYFWDLGYGGFWQAGRREEALGMFQRGLSAWPWDAAAWKTYVLAWLRVAWSHVFRSAS